MSDGMDIDGDVAPQAIVQAEPSLLSGPAMAGPQQAGTSMSLLAPTRPEGREAQAFREIPVKVHIRKPERDSWTYLGRAVVAYEPTGPLSSPRVVVRATATQKVMTIFDTTYEVQAEKRGNFVVIGCLEGSRVISWSLNALNNSETLRLLTIIELACPYCTKALDPHRPISKTQRRIDRVIKDDRRKRHRRRKDADEMVNLFAQSTIDGAAEAVAAT